MGILFLYLSLPIIRTFTSRWSHFYRTLFVIETFCMLSCRSIVSHIAFSRQMKWAHSGQCVCGFVTDKICTAQCKYCVWEDVLKFDNCDRLSCVHQSTDDRTVSSHFFPWFWHLFLSYLLLWRKRLHAIAHYQSGREFIQELIIKPYLHLCNGMLWFSCHAVNSSCLLV